MYPPNAQQALAAACAQSLVQIERDLLRARPPIVNLLAHLRDHLFDARLDATRLCQACALDIRTISGPFRCATGYSPKAYILRLRLKTASQLLTNTNISISEIATLVGFASANTFGRAFGRMHRCSPAQYRKQLDRPSTGLGAPSDKTSDQILVKALTGAADTKQVISLARSLVERWTQNNRGVSPQGLDAIGTGDLTGDAGGVGSAAAAAAWLELRDRPPDEQRALIHMVIRPSSAALFRHLQREAIAAGRVDRQDRCTIAELALSAATAYSARSHCAVTARSLVLEAWVDLAHARRLCFDFRGATEALNHARLLSVEAPQMENRVRVLLATAALSWFQRQHQSALAFLDEAEQLLLVAQQPQETIRALMLRAQVLTDLDLLQDSVTSLERALGLAVKQGDEQQCQHIRQNLAAVQARRGRYARAQSILLGCKPEPGDLDAVAHFHWVHGYVTWERGDLAGAEGLLRVARQQLADAGLAGDAAIVRLHESLLSIQQRRFDEAIAHVLEALPLLSALKASRDTAASLRVLQAAVANGSITANAVQALVRSLPGGGVLRPPDRRS